MDEFSTQDWISFGLILLLAVCIGFAIRSLMRSYLDGPDEFED